MRRFSLAFALILAFAGSTGAFWQTRDSNYNQNITSGGGGGASITALTSGTNPCATSSCTVISGQTFTAGIVVVGFSADLAGFTTPTGVTINGVSGTQVGSSIADAFSSMQMWYANVGSGTGNIVVSAAGAIGQICLSAWTITGASSTTPVATNSFNGISSTQADPQGPMSSITLSSGDVGAFWIGAPFHAAANPTTWVQSTRDAATEVGTGAGNQCSAAGSHISAAGTYSGITATGSVSWLYAAMLGATWH